MTAKSAQPLNSLIRAVLDDFRGHFAPQSTIIHVGEVHDGRDMDDREAFAELGVNTALDAELPDVMLVDLDARRLILVEAVTSHGPVSALRRRQLAEIFSAVTLGIVYVTAFESRAALAPYLDEISWETEVWLADAPTHLIHFDGERFLGPYNDGQQERTTR